MVEGFQHAIVRLRWATLRCYKTIDKLLFTVFFFNIYLDMRSPPPHDLHNDFLTVATDVQFLVGESHFVKMQMPTQSQYSKIWWLVVCLYVQWKWFILSLHQFKVDLTSNSLVELNSFLINNTFSPFCLYELHDKVWACFQRLIQKCTSTYRLICLIFFPKRVCVIRNSIVKVIFKSTSKEKLKIKNAIKMQWQKCS